MTAFVVDRSPRGLVVVGGPDATSFLQSLVSQDLEAIADGAGAPSLLLTPQGKLDVVFRATHAGDEWWLDTEADFGARLAESLTRYRIRVKAEIDDRTASSGLLSIIGRSVTSPALLALPTAWDDEPGTDLLGAAGEVERERDALPSELERRDPEQFEAFRIEHGVPRLGVDLDEKTIPQEAFLDRDAVSFTKGCFLGQELVARIDSRGHVNRYLRRLRIEGRHLPAPGATVVADDKEVGTVTSAAVVPGEDRVVALAMIRREVEPPAQVTVTWNEGTATAQASAHVWASQTYG